MSESTKNALIFRLNENGQGPDIIRQVFLEKGWQEFDEDVHEEFEWNMWWRTSRFRNSDYDQIQPWQRLNHYPKSIAITKKDCLARNLKRMKGVYGASVYNFSPMAFNLPNDYTKFVAEYTKQKEKSSDKLLWICKPADLSRGRGIFIFKELSELQYDCNAVLQQYITNPLLMAGYKFDLRIYVMVPSFHPLQIYIYEEGLVRFGTEKYDLTTLSNLYSHLTNTSINKHSPSYNVDKERVGPGCKWTLTQLRHYLRQSSMDDVACWGKIINIVIMTVIIQTSQVPKVPCCFELFGFDIMIDENMKPWLLEVNFSPSLSYDCPIDIQVKKPLIHDLLDMMHFSKEDGTRGGDDFRQKQMYKLYAANHFSRIPSRVSYKAGPTPYKTGKSKLPNITKSSSSVTINDSLPGEDDDDKDSEIIPIIPGCGLPSVQQPPSQRPMSSSTRSTTSSEDSKKAGRPPSQHVNIYNSQKSLTVPGQSANRCNGSPHNSSLYKYGQKATRLYSPAKQKYPLYKQDSKNSMKSDSGISCHSGSSDNSDPVSGRTKDTPTSGSKYGLRGMTLRNRTAEKQTVNISGENTSQVAKSTLTSSQPGPFAYDGPTMSKSLQNHRNHHSVQTSHSRKFMLNNRSITAENFSPNPVSSQPLSQQIPTKPRISNSFHSRPWRTKGQTTTGTAKLEDLSPRVGTRNPPSRVGDFALVFPFNENTKRCSLTNLDTKIVIRECHKLLKERNKAQTSTESESIPPNSQPSECFANVTQFWGVLKEDGTVHS